MRQPVDGATAALVRATLQRCANSGKDPVLALMDKGLLRTSLLAKQDAADTLLQAADLLNQLTCKQLAGAARMPTSPLDTKNLVERWLREQGTQMLDAMRRGA